MFAPGMMDSLTGHDRAEGLAAGRVAGGSGLTPERTTLRDVLAAVLYHRRAMTIAFLIPVVLAVLAALVSKPAYIAQARLLVLYSSDYLYRPAIGQNGSSVALDRNQIVLGELQVLQSEVLAEETMRQVGLARVYPGARGRNENEALSRAAERFEQDLSLTSVPQSNILELSFRSRDPHVAAEVLTTLIDKYLARRAEVFDRPSAPASRQDQDDFLRRLHAAEDALASFAAANGITNLDQQTGLLLQEQSAASQARDSAAQEVAETSARLAVVEEQLSHASPTINSYADTDRSQQSQILTDSLLKLQIKRRDLAGRYQDDFPAVRDLDRQIADVRAQLAAAAPREGAAIRTGVNPVFESLTTQALSLHAQLSGAQAQVASLSQQESAAEARLRALTSAGRQYRDLQRNRDVLDDGYRAVMRSMEEVQAADLAEHNGGANVRVIQPPEVPAAGKSLRKVIVAAGIALGVIAAIATMATLTAVRQVFVTARDVADALGLPVLAAIDELSPTPSRRRRVIAGA